jgi:hypothetical protein
MKISPLRPGEWSCLARIACSIEERPYDCRNGSPELLVTCEDDGGGRVTAVVDGPAWSGRGLVQHDSRYPLKAEGAVRRAVKLLLPGVSTASEFVRYFALYAALAGHADDDGLAGEACRELVRRSEVVLAGVSLLDEERSAGPVGRAHGVDGVRPWFGDGLDVAGAVSMGAEQHSYSPRKSGFWGSYGGPSQILGTVAVEDSAFRAGRHACPAEVRALFRPLFTAAGRDRLTVPELEVLRPVSLASDDLPEVPWLLDLFTATRGGVHERGQWQPDDVRRRATLRILGRTTELYGTDVSLTWADAVESAVAFSDALETDAVLAGIGEAAAWRGLLLRNYSVSAWRRLWAALVRSIGEEDDFSDRSAGELQAWLADQMPGGTVRAFMDQLPPGMTGRHPAPAERIVLAAGGARNPVTGIQLLLLGARRATELHGEARTVFLGQQNEILNPLWMEMCVREFLDRPLRDLAVRLVDDMLAQAGRIALDKVRPDLSGRLQVYSRIHERNGRYYKTRDEGDAPIGTRLDVAAGIAVQLGLIDLAGDGAATVTDLGAAVLETAQ